MESRNWIYKILKKTEHYAKTDMVYLARGGFWLTSSQIITSLSAFFLALAFANFLPKETYGIYKYILSIAGILAISTLDGIDAAIIRSVARGYEGSLIPALKTKMKWGLLGGTAGLVLAGYYFIKGDITLTISFLITAAFLPFLDPFNIYNSLLQGRKLFKSFTKYKIISQIIAIAFLVATLFLTQNIFLILLAYFMPWTAMRFIFLKRTVKLFKPNQNIDPITISYGKHLSFIGIISVVAGHLDKILVFHYLGAVELAIYAFAVAIPEQIKGFLSNLNTLIFPKFSERSAGEIKAGMKNKLIKLFFLSLLIVGAYVALAPFIYNLFFPQYKDSIFYSQLFALSMLNLTFTPLGVFLKAKKRIKEQYVSNLISSVFKIAIIIIFILWQGLIGLVIARVLSRFVGSLLNMVFYYRPLSDAESES